MAEVASGKPFDQLIRENVFIPLGMTDTTFHPTPEQGERVAGIYKPVPWGGQINLLKWDPDKEMFPNDSEASAMLKRPMRKPWSLS